jgi:hypothetical protein
MHFDDGAAAFASADLAAIGPWVEVTGPIADALGALARAIQNAPGTLAGASIAVSDHETLLLNERAWALFEGALATVPDLATRAPVPGHARPIRFLLLSGGEKGIA